jgi:SNF2 family DNA or RNA helicase
MLKTNLRGYQQEAVNRALIDQRTGFCVFSEPRSGKSLIAIAIADRILPSRFLIVCPKKAIRVWNEQIAEHWEWDNFYVDVQILNFEQVQKRRHKLKKWIQGKTPGDSRFSMMVVDESHRIKRRGSKQSRACRLIGKYAGYRLALTGTPLSKQRSIEDAWAQFDFINPELFGRYSDLVNRKTGELIEEGFESRFLIKGGFRGKKVVGYKNKKEFYRIFHANSFRRTLREVREHPLLIRKVKKYVQMSPEAKRAYSQLEKTLATVVRKKKIEVKLIVSLSTKLQQVVGGWIIPGLRHEGDPVRVGREKLTALSELLTRLPFAEKLVICAKYLHEIQGIVDIVKAHHRTVETIQGGTEFDGRFTTDVIVIQIQSGLAIDLSAAKTIIWYSWDFSHINHEQMRFRILSYNTKKVTYYYLIMRNSIDEQIYEAIARKKKLATLVCDYYRKRMERV